MDNILNTALIVIENQAPAREDSPKRITLGIPNSKHLYSIIQPSIMKTHELISTEGFDYVAYSFLLNYSKLDVEQHFNQHNKRPIIDHVAEIYNAEFDLHPKKRYFVRDYLHELCNEIEEYREALKNLALTQCPRVSNHLAFGLFAGTLAVCNSSGDSFLEKLGALATGVFLLGGTSYVLYRKDYERQVEQHELDFEHNATLLYKQSLEKLLG